MCELLLDLFFLKVDFVYEKCQNVVQAELEMAYVA